MGRSRLRLARIRTPAIVASFAIGTSLVGCARGTGRTIQTAPTTGAALALASRPTPDSVLARAHEAWRLEQYPEAGSRYEAIVASDSAAPSVAVFRLATLRSWDNRLDDAVRLFRRYVALEPRDTEGRLALGRAIAWSGRYSDALAIYDSILAQDASYRDAMLARGQTLAWAGRFGEALSTYERWLTTHPSDRGASLDLARALAWSGRLDEAEALYVKLAVSGDPNARKGLARVLGWRGELDRSEWEWRRAVDALPTDAEALTGLAQILRWQGRSADAKLALDRAVLAQPGYGDARTLLRWVRADLRPHASTTLLNANDSDDNRMTMLQLDVAARAGWNGALGGRYTERDAAFAGTDSRARAIGASASWHPGAGSWVVRGDAGVARHTSSLGTAPVQSRTIGSGGLRVGGAVGRAVRLGIGVSRIPFDETALLIANGIVMSEVAGEASVTLPARLTLAGAASHARVTGGARENSRLAWSSSLRWTANRRWSMAVGGRRFGYDTTSVDGYFSPRRYTLFEGSMRGRLGGDLGWNAEGEAGLGRQHLLFFGATGGSRRAERLTATLGYRFTPAHDVGVSGGYANVAGAGQQGGSEYRTSSIALRAKVGL